MRTCEKEERNTDFHKNQCCDILWHTDQNCTYSKSNDLGPDRLNRVNDDPVVIDEFHYFRSITPQRRN